ncbi:uncharacterized protein (TIGR02646 family) [Algoriphagus boseongensis]|uniref:Uncharacterized protein (TIGR02646 family) n=1 Tax=Algoriphagus boseongensis TaxID=1442587 RepID=A0A4R6T9P7_9BACT|nr:HNH endonuclease [Algoriphagus boseongensis]TDQ18602.1 uncharacterized protein (TIGR02646 family) [Algoriphagus boseongensis]
MNQPFLYQSLRITITFNLVEQAIINRLKPLDGSEWDGNIKSGCSVTKAERDKLVTDIKTKLETIQGSYCIYCGIHSDYRGHLQREHILSKSSRNYPNFMFEPRNLVLACRVCNMDLKRTKDFGSKERIKYRKNTFSIIHPYIDDFNRHLKFFGSGHQVLIQKMPYSRKGKKTIEVFELDSVARTVERSGLIDQYEKHIDPKFLGTLALVLGKKYFK